MPVAVYDNLIAAVRRQLPALHRYFDLRRRKMKLKDIHHYDTYVPILSDLDKRHTWDQAVEGDRRVAGAAGRASTASALEQGLRRPLVRSLPQPRQAERRLQLRLASTAIRTS